jgi:hypothetical protein
VQSVRSVKGKRSRRSESRVAQTREKSSLEGLGVAVVGGSSQWLNGQVERPGCSDESPEDNR